jgi:lipopolysaccharide cholinephosphotransferase
MKNFKNKNDIDFPTSDEYPKETILRVQEELIKMSKLVCGIFEKNNIPYFMAYGTLIGAIKFQGFLPWDDDIDLFLFDENYNDAISLLEKELPNHLIVHGEKNDPNYFLAWNSVKNKNIEVEANDIYNKDNKLLNYRCLGIDLYRLKKININDTAKYKKDEAVKFFERKLNSGIINTEVFENSLKKIETEYNIQNESKNTINNNIEVYIFVVKMNNIILPTSIFPLRKYKFENLELFGPNNPIEVLSSSFDNLGELPSYKERKPHLKKVVFKEFNNDN